MKKAVIFFNLASLAFTLFVIATDGPATKPAYVAFSLLLIGAPAVTVFVLARDGGATPARLAALLNAVLLAAVVAAFIARHPHPDEPGFLPYVALILLTPIASVVALLCGFKGRGAAVA